jgi:hypothetical protein
MAVELRPVGSRAVITLRVAPDQADFVSSNAAPAPATSMVRHVG